MISPSVHLRSQYLIKAQAKLIIAENVLEPVGLQSRLAIQLQTLQTLEVGTMLRILL